MVDRATRAANVRRALGDAALDLFAERGFDAVTVDEVAERAGVSRRTVFRHAPTKADLVLGHHPAWVAVFRAGLSEVEGPSGRRLRAAARLVSAEAESDAERILRAMSIALAEPAVRARVAELDQEWLELVAEVVAADEAVDPIDVPLVAGAVMGMIGAALAAWAEAGGGDLAALVERGFDLLFGGSGDA